VDIRNHESEAIASDRTLELSAGFLRSTISGFFGCKPLKFPETAKEKFGKFGARLHPVALWRGRLTGS
jgi:hypothetical protein